MSDDAAAALLAHDWPGNVRELRNSIERAKLLAREQLVTAGGSEFARGASQRSHGETLGAAARRASTRRSRRRTTQPRADRGQLARSRRQHQPRRAQPRTVAPGSVSAHGAVQSAAVSRRAYMGLRDSIGVVAVRRGVAAAAAGRARAGAAQPVTRLALGGSRRGSRVLWLAARLMRPIRQMLRALSGTVASYREGDFSLSLVAERRTSSAS